MNNKIQLIFDEVCRVLGLPRPLIEHWLKSGNGRRVDELNAAAELINSAGVPVDQLQMALDNWKVSDWRGRKGEPPTPTLFGEHAVIFWGRWTKTQEELRGLDLERPRWRGEYDQLRADRGRLEQERAERDVGPDEWEGLARKFESADRPGAAAACRARV
jgi:hypothetical protein